MAAEDSLSNLPTSQLLGSVPAVVTEAKSPGSHQAPGANLQIFPPNNGGNNWRGYQTLGGNNEEQGQQSADPSSNSWNGFFSISSYTQYFNVDTDIVLNRILSTFSPTSGDFFNKIDANPDLYGLVWISTTLIFVITSLGNCATYLIQRRHDSSTLWNFDVSYVNVATCAIYGYALLVPLGFYFLLQYLGSNASLVRFWCLWGYSLFIFILSSFLLIIPVNFLRWMVILISGAASAGFVSLNLRSYVQSTDLNMVLVAAFVLQIGLAVFIKMWFFP
ncbi:OLC1v1026633C1 [Oldenlandia corymbosa var. corymbosa]|uniref:Protein YIP n=1 Tax=Oldenlandia corymbosa var. corymbosa TaxID=529605 RepID=A0AAV1C994_OLDCO|nr:OLC1v1026633C1 [Oldenlandia corymbosa var. corymbosa]